MQRQRRTVVEWFADNWLELILVLVFLVALVALARTGWALLPVSSDGQALVPTAVASLPSPTMTPVAGILPEEQQDLPAATTTATPETLTFDGARALGYAGRLAALGPRPTGSTAQSEAGDFIVEELQRLGWEVEEQVFEANGAQRRNIIARTGSGSVLIAGTHYDTQPTADRDLDPEKRTQAVPGANDGASGAAVLLELARALDRDQLQNQVWLAFFDAKYGSTDTSDSQPTSMGADHMVQTLEVQPTAMILVDMVGDEDQELYFDSNADPRLSNQVWQVADQLGYARWFTPEVKPNAVNDHLPFANVGISTVVLIDEDYPYWQTTDDTVDKISSQSLERVGRVLEVFIEEQVDL